MPMHWPVPVEPDREVVELGQRRRRERGVGVRRQRAWRAAVDLEVRVRLRSVVQAEDTFHDVGQGGRYRHAADPAAVGAAGVFVLVQGDVEGGGHRGAGAGEDDTAAPGIGRHHLQVVGGRESGHLGQVVRRGAMACRVLRPGQVVALGRHGVRLDRAGGGTRRGLGFGSGPDHQGHFHAFVRARRTDDMGAADGHPRAAGNDVSGEFSSGHGVARLVSSGDSSLPNVSRASTPRPMHRVKFYTPFAGATRGGAIRDGANPRLQSTPSRPAGGRVPCRFHHGTWPACGAPHHAGVRAAR